MKKYADTFQRWNSWAKSKGLQALPATGHELALYLAFLIKSAKSMATIYNAVYEIAWAHQKMSMASPTEHPIVKQIMEASKRIIGTKPKNPERPLELEHIKTIIGKLGSGDQSNLQTCLVVLGFSGFLRWDDLSRLRRKELEFEREYMSVSGKKEK